MSSSSRPVLVVTGLAAEARLVEGDGIVCLSAPPASLPGKLDAAVRLKPWAVVSFGLAGGLAAGLQAGSLVMATGVVSGGGRSMECAAALNAAWLARLQKAGVDTGCGLLAAFDMPLLTAREKQACRRATGAIAVDTESHLAAAFAERHALPFAVLRAISDPVDRDLPPLAMNAIGANGRLDFPAIGRELLARPNQILRLPRTALMAARAMRTLRRVRLVLGPGLGVAHLG